MEQGFVQTYRGPQMGISVAYRQVFQLKEQAASPSIKRPVVIATFQVLVPRAADLLRSLSLWLL